METVQHWKQMLNYLDTVCSDCIREVGHHSRPNKPLRQYLR